MEELYMLLIKIFMLYGWQLTLCAISGIVLLGILKHFKAFDKIVILTKVKLVNAETGEVTCNKVFNEKLTKQIKKIIYIAISLTLSVGARALYLYLCHTFTVTLMFTVAGAILSLTLTTYALYENFGVRYVLHKFYEKIKSNFNKIIINIKSAKAATKAEKEKANAELIESGKTAIENAYTTIAGTCGITVTDIHKAVEMIQTLKSK